MTVKAGEINTLGTIPAEFRPSAPATNSLAYYSNGIWLHYFFVVEMNGKINYIASKDNDYIPPFIFNFVLK